MKKIISFMLAAIMLIATIPLGAVSVNAATTPSTVTVAQATERLNTLIGLLDGKYFTTTGAACATNESGHGCSKCYAKNVLAQQWIQSLIGMGTINVENFPRIYYSKTNVGDYHGYSCFGFACFAHWYIFAQKNTDNIVGKFVAQGSLNKSTLDSARPGDVLWFSNDYSSNGHAGIYVKHDSTGFTVLDCNWRHTAPNKNNCYVNEDTFSYSSFGYNYVAITGVENYSRETSTGSSTSGVKNRIDQIIADLKIKFPNGKWNINDTDCSLGVSGHGCSKCSVYNIVKQKYGETWSSAQCTDGQSCNGFAKYVFVRLFGSTISNATDTKIGNGQTASTYDKCKMGDLIGNGHHYMIYISHDSSGVTVLDANGDAHSTIGYYKKYSYSHGNLSGTVTVTHSNKWNEVNDQYGSSTAVNPGKPVLKNLNKTYKNTDQVTFEWDTTANTTHYNLYIRTVTSEADTDYTNVYETIHYAENGLQRSLPVGKYRVLLQSTNKNATGADGTGWAYTDGDWIYLEVVPSYDVLDSITINTLPDRTTYILDEPFSGKGLTVKLKYVGGAERIISDGFTVTGFDSSSEGTKTVAVKYGDLAATFDVEVVDSEDWSGWFPAEALPDEVKNATWGYEIEHKDGYLTREREIKISGKQNEDGWTLYDTKTSSLTASDYATTKPSTTPVVKDDRVETKSYKTYYYYYLYGYEKNGDPTYMAEKTKADLINNHSLSSYDKSKLRYIYVYSETSHGETWPQYSGAAYYTDDNGKSGTINVNNGNVHFYYGGERYKVTTTTTQYYHCKWSDWDNLYETEPTATDDVEVSVAENAFVRFRKTNEPQPAVITGIAVADAQYKTEYLVGEDLDLTNVSLNVYYSDGRSGVVFSGYDVSGFDSSVCGKQTVTLTYGGFTSTIEINVTAPQIILNDKEIYMTVGETHQLSISVVPQKLDAPRTFISSDSSIVEAFMGRLTAKAPGTVTITALTTYKGVNYTDTCTVIVSEADGTATIENAAAKPGEDVAVKVILDNAPEIKSMAISDVTFNLETLALLGGEWNVDNSVLSSWDESTGKGVVTLKSAEDLNGNVVFTLTFHVSDAADEGFYSISLKVSAKDKNNAAINVATVTGGVTVRNYIVGDVNGDGEITDEDAIYLLFYTFFPEEYPIEQPCDFNGDGEVTDEDAIYLLFYTFFPEEYPIA